MNYYNISNSQSAQPNTYYNPYTTPSQPLIDSSMQYTYQTQGTVYPPVQTAIPVQQTQPINYNQSSDSIPVIDVQVTPQQQPISNSYQPTNFNKPIAVDVVPSDQTTSYQSVNANQNQLVDMNTMNPSQPQQPPTIHIEHHEKIADDKESWNWFGCPVMALKVSIVCMILDVMFGPFGVLISACLDLNGYNSTVAFVAIIELFLSPISIGYILSFFSGILTIIRNKDRM